MMLSLLLCTVSFALLMLSIGIGNIVSLFTESGLPGLNNVLQFVFKMSVFGLGLFFILSLFSSEMMNYSEKKGK